MTGRHVTDPADELFDVLTEDGSPTGETKRRADVHRDGDWHRAFHLWVVQRPAEGPDHVLFQRRADGKDTWPNRLDVAVGGHFRAGETIDDVVREIDEEIGIEPERSDLVFVGSRRAVNLNSEWRDREIQVIYILPIRGRLPTFEPNGVELEGLVRVSIDDLVSLFYSEASEVPSMAAPVIADRVLGDWQQTTLTVDDFVPVKDDYWVRGARAGHALLSGSEGVSLDLA